MPPFTVRCVHVQINEDLRGIPVSKSDILFRGQPDVSGSPEQHGLPLVGLRALGPLAWVTLFGFFISIALLIISIALGDGMSLIATILLSGLSTLVGISNKWELRLPRYHKPGSIPPPGDLVIRYPNKSFLIVFCEEEVARELFWGVDEIKYHIRNGTTYRMISLAGTLMLMLGVIVLSNAKLPLKFCWTGAYLVLNAAHWAAAALPQRLHWDFSRFKLEEQGIAGGPRNDTYMDAVGKAVIVTKSVEWLRLGRLVPFTRKWDEWLIEAERVANTVGNGPGIVEDPLWKHATDDGVGKVWDVPQAERWTARRTWDRINSGHDYLRGGRGDDSTEPVLGASDPTRLRNE